MFCHITNFRNRDSTVGITTGYGSRWGKEFLLLHVVQTDPGVHPTSYEMGTGGSFSGGKGAGT
jgi:hypothetical protein